MDLDKFMKSQTFKTGTFVVVVLFVLLFVFKLGILHGQKRATYLHGGRDYSRQIYGGKYFGNHSGVFGKYMHNKLLLKKKFIEGKIMLDSETDEESEAEEPAQ